MASSGDEGLPAQQPMELSSNSESSDPNGFGSSVCRWRNEQFNEQECSRYFDCPSHTIERAASDTDSDEVMYNNSDDAESNHDSSGGDNDRDHEMRDLSRSTSHEDILPFGNTLGEEVAVAHSPLPAPAPAPTAAAPSPQIPSPQATAQLGVASGTVEDPVVLANSPPSLPSPLPSRGLTLDNPVVIDDEAMDAHGGAAGASSVPSSAASGGGANPAPPTPGSANSTGSQSFVLPRWQPDAEVTYCPICGTQFSIFIRKHHCRKCGRVVCNSCSPHRITIPYQYIVQPFGTPALRPPAFPVGREGEHVIFHTLGGGERVRLCNPCVPDPNINPPAAQNSPAQRTHARSQSGENQRYPGNSAPSSLWSGYLGAAPAADAYARGRSVTLASNTSSSSTIRPSNLFLSTSAQNRPSVGTPPPYYTSPSAAAQRAYQDQNRPRPLLNFGGPGPSSSASRVNRRLPPIPQTRPQIAEEDECPVCHRELPERTLPNFEALREAHITICIATHSGYGGTPPAGASPGSGDGASPPPPPPRRTGMFPYVATEKDCVDSAECTICLEEFEVGVPMARLECLCRFHRRCIAAWWERHPGRCPMHQHDSLGY